MYPPYPPPPPHTHTHICWPRSCYSMGMTYCVETAKNPLHHVFTIMLLDFIFFPSDPNVAGPYEMYPYIWQPSTTPWMPPRSCYSTGLMSCGPTANTRTIDFNFSLQIPMLLAPMRCTPYIWRPSTTLLTRPRSCFSTGLTSCAVTANTRRPYIMLPGKEINKCWR